LEPVLKVAFRICISDEPYMKPNSQFHLSVELELRFGEGREIDK
jgi:hypothetical protein